jgi:hypothetical protein
MDAEAARDARAAPLPPRHSPPRRARGPRARHHRSGARRARRAATGAPRSRHGARVGLARGTAEAACAARAAPLPPRNTSPRRERRPRARHHRSGERRARRAAPPRHSTPRRARGPRARQRGSGARRAATAPEYISAARVGLAHATTEEASAARARGELARPVVRAWAARGTAKVTRAARARLGRYWK